MEPEWQYLTDTNKKDQWNHRLAISHFIRSSRAQRLNTRTWKSDPRSNPGPTTTDCVASGKPFLNSVFKAKGNKGAHFSKGCFKQNSGKLLSYDPVHSLPQHICWIEFTKVKSLSASLIEKLLCTMYQRKSNFIASGIWNGLYMNKRVEILKCTSNVFSMICDFTTLQIMVFSYRFLKIWQTSHWHVLHLSFYTSERFRQLFLLLFSR